MAHLYCRNCGHKNEYSLKKPSFCGNCGSPMGATAESLASVPAAKFTKPARVARPLPQNFDEEDSDSDYVPNIQKLKYSIEKPNSGKISIEQVMASTSPSEKLPTRPKLNMTPEEVLADNIIKPANRAVIED